MINKIRFLFFCFVRTKIAQTFFVLVCVASLFAVLPSSAKANHCAIPFGATGYFFDNFQNAEYVNNLLVFHFKLQTPYNDGRAWMSNFRFLSDECQRGTVDSYASWVSITPGVQYFSVRFVSPTHFEIWNDETNIKEPCINCSQDVPAYPGYYEMILNGSIDGGASFLQSSSYRISDTASDPPIKTNTLPTPPNCQPFSVGGYNSYFFDHYEHAEYINGFLAYHFRLQTPYNDGRPWGSSVRLYDGNCSAVGSFTLGGSLWLLNTHLIPYLRYYSVRFSSATHYDIWNDETNQIVACYSCSVDVPATLSGGQPYSFISFGGSIDGAASWLQSTPFPIEGAAAAPSRDPVIIVPGILGSAEKNNTWVIDPIFHTYDDLIATLAINGYTEGKDLFTFPYDWHVTNKLTALMLRDKINEVKGICKCGKVDLVAHSMGGLIARQYIQSSQYQNDVDQLIFLGTPHLGAPDDYLVWEGADFGARLRDSALKFVLSREAKKAGFGNLFDYVHNKPIASVQELLPISDYIFDSNVLRHYPNNYPRNVFLENLDSTTNLLLSSGVKITNIIGDEVTESTPTSFDVVQSDELPFWEDGKPTNTNFGFGDETVPFSSAARINQDLIATTSSHTSLPTNAEGVVFEKLTGKKASTEVRAGFIDNFPNLKLLIIKILSPVDVQVIAPDGKRIGKDFQTGGEFNEVDGAFYSGFLTDDEYVTIPNPLDGEYKIETQGTGIGEYTVATGYIADNASVTKDFIAQTRPNLAAELNVEVNNLNPGTLNVKPSDITPPIISINAPQAKDYLRSDILPVNIDIHDTESGVFSSQIKFDDRIISASTTADLFFEKLGAHNITVSASDFVGNAATSTVGLRVTASIQSAGSDVGRAYALGWITKKNVRDSLTKDLQKIKVVNVKTVKSFLHELDKNHPRYINDQAYNVLKEDINWLLNH